MVNKKEVTFTITLPFDIVHSILLILPAKSLQRFKTVCKSWNAIISDHDFVENHLRRSRSLINQYILVMRTSCLLRYGELRLLKLEKDKFQVEAIQENHNLNYDKLLCSSDDGLLLISNFKYCSRHDVLWLRNPSSKQQTRISSPHRFDLGWTTFGFCRGPVLDNYRIVAIYREYYAVFSCKNKVWTGEKEFPYSSWVILRKRGVFVDGFSFFVMKMIEVGSSEIVYFDPRDETFNMLQKPRELKDFGNFFLTSLRGCLCVYNDTRFGNRLEIWIGRDCINVDSNSWTKYIIFDYARAITRRINWLTPLFITEKNELVLMLSNNGREGEFGIYNSMKEKYEKLDVPPSKEICNSETVPYVDSLFFPSTRGVSVIGL